MGRNGKCRIGVSGIVAEITSRHRDYPAPLSPPPLATSPLRLGQNSKGDQTGSPWKGHYIVSMSSNCLPSSSSDASPKSKVLTSTTDIGFATRFRNFTPSL